MRTVTSSSSASTTERHGDRQAPRRLWPVVLGGAGSGILLWMGHPPADIGLLGFVALVPMLLVARSPKRGASAGLVSGIVFFGLLLRWVFPFAWFAWFFLVAFLALQMVLVGWMAGAIFTRLGTVWWLVGIPAVLALTEWVRGRWPLGGFAWGELGTTQQGITVTRSLAAVGGVVALSWLVGVVNCIFAVLIDAALRRRPAPRGTAAAAAAVVLVVTLGGWMFRPRTDPVGELSVGIVQANRFEDDDVSPDKMVEEHMDATETLPRGLDLIVWGESSIWDQPITEMLTGEIADSAGGVPVLANAYVRGPDDTTFENTNLLIGPDGDVVDRYVKRHVVPFGERVPWRSALGFVRQLDQVPRDAVPGDAVGTFDTAGGRAASVICFESAFSDPVRDSVREGAEGIFVLTNNASFGRSELSEQYLALTRMRAVENHRAEAVVAVSGRSALIDADGAMRVVTGLFEPKTLEWGMPLHDDRTIYTRFGDWFVFVAVALVACTLAAMRSRRRVPDDTGVLDILGSDCGATGMRG